MTTVGVTGHQEIPAEALEYVRGRMVDHLCRLPAPLVGNTALAAGADQLFAEVVLDCGGTLHVVLPSRDYPATLPDPAALERFFALKRRAHTVEVLDHAEASEAAYLAAGQRIVELSEHLVAVWDGLPARGKGGTADIVAYARTRGRTVLVLWPEGVVRE